MLVVRKAVCAVAPSCRTAEPVEGGEGEEGVERESSAVLQLGASQGPLTHKIQLVRAVPFPFRLSCVYSPPFTTIHCGMWTELGRWAEMRKRM